MQAILREGHPLAALQVFHAELGDIFQINLPGFSPVVLVGPQAARFVLVEGRNALRWRNENDPVVTLLRHGVLVEDGEAHDELRRLMNPPLHKKMLESYLQVMLEAIQQVSAGWKPGMQLDMLVEMRKIALLILVGTLFKADYAYELKRLWRAVIDTIRYISPGIWMLWRKAPRWGYQAGIQRLDDYLYRLIRERRALLVTQDTQPQDLLGILIISGMQDDLIRDQLLTMLIAGHDTSTALLAWSWYLLGSHPQVYRQVKAEANLMTEDDFLCVEKLNSLEWIGNLTREALRLYPPIHLGSRLAAIDLDYCGYTIPAGERVIYSIYLTQRHPAYWSNPNEFIPARHLSSQPVPYAWLAFGGGPRNCIGAAFGQVESRLVLAYLLRKFDFELTSNHVRPHMGATLEPHPGVYMRILNIPGC